MIEVVVVGSCHRNFHIVFECMYMGISGYICVYTSLLKESVIHIGKSESTSSYNSEIDC
jgi:hypothetical protein